MGASRQWRTGVGGGQDIVGLVNLSSFRLADPRENGVKVLIVWLPALDIVSFPMGFDPRETSCGVEDCRFKSAVRAVIYQFENLHMVTTYAFVLSILM
jgi:hypothetical protein